MTSQVSVHQPLSHHPLFLLTKVHFCKIFRSNVVIPESAFTVFVDSTPARVRHASVHDDADPDSGNTISQSVAMAIAGSPLPHAKANPTVVSDNSRGQAVPLGTAD